MRKFLGRFLLPALAAGMLIFAVLHVVKAQQVPPRPPPPVEPARTPFGRTVAGAGIVEARTQNISLGAPIAGIILEVYGPKRAGMAPWDALIGETVQQGDKLFLVDDRQLNAQLKSAEANVKSAEAQLAKLENQPRPEEVDPAKAGLAVAKAQRAMQLDLAERDRRLIPSGSASEEEYRQRMLAAEVAKQQEIQSQKQLDLITAGAWKYDKDIARANVEVARAQADQIRTDLGRVLVRAPVDGVVLQVNIRPGEFVGAQPGQAVMVLGATDKTVHVRVDVDEHDIPRFRPGAPARASLRGTPDVTYPLKFVRVEPYVIPKKSLTGDNTERVDTRVLQVIYALDATDKPVYVGQQMDVFIDVGAEGGA
jgi:multidrug resistance efflux pump